ncbi:hypothetical protein HanRHA438_Chr14g0630601 [Helianthus annuus]|nr:hypothetical protein HanRHA438_Chr14g0630601 [Helianthus annuus]
MVPLNFNVRLEMSVGCGGCILAYTRCISKATTIRLITSVNAYDVFLGFKVDNRSKSSHTHDAVSTGLWLIRVKVCVQLVIVCKHDRRYHRILLLPCHSVLITGILSTECARLSRASNLIRFIKRLPTTLSYRKKEQYPFLRI